MGGAGRTDEARPEPQRADGRRAAGEAHRRVRKGICYTLYYTIPLYIPLASPVKGITGRRFQSESTLQEIEIGQICPISISRLGANYLM